MKRVKVKVLATNKIRIAALNEKDGTCRIAMGFKKLQKDEFEVVEDATYEFKSV